jgi:GT2 family glycosyltransferase
VLKYTDPNVKILVIDNGSTDGTIDYLRELENDSIIDLIENGENIGIAKSLNKGIKWCGDDDFCFVSNDVVVGYNWLERLRAGVYSHCEIGGGCPYICPERTDDTICNSAFRENYRSFIKPKLQKEPTYIELEQMLDSVHGTSFDSFTRNWVSTRKGMSPFYEWFSMVMYIKKSTIDKVGLFDEQFSPTHWEDIDYMVRMNNVDLFRISVTDSYCFHWSTITTRQEFNDFDPVLRSKADANYHKFNKKWKIFLPEEQKRFDIPDGDKYPPMVYGKLQPWKVVDQINNRPYHKWCLWEPEKYPEIYQTGR